MKEYDKQVKSAVRLMNDPCVPGAKNVRSALNMTNIPKDILANKKNFEALSKAVRREAKRADRLYPCSTSTGKCENGYRIYQKLGLKFADAASTIVVCEECARKLAWEQTLNGNPLPSQTVNPVLKSSTASASAQTTANASGRQLSTTAAPPKAAANNKRKSPTKDTTSKKKSADESTQRLDRFYYLNGKVMEAPTKKKTRVTKKVVKKYRIVQPDGSVVISTQPPSGGAAPATANTTTNSGKKGSGTEEKAKTLSEMQI
jgi:hypothetical protein